MTVVMKKFTTRLSWKPKANRKPRFFLQNLPTPTDRKHFETVNNTRTLFCSQQTTLHQYSQHNRDSDEKLPWGRELNRVVELFPQRVVSELALICRLKRRSFLHVKENVHHLQTVNARCNMNHYLCTQTAIHLQHPHNHGLAQRSLDPNGLLCKVWNGWIHSWYKQRIIRYTSSFFLH